MRCFLVLLSGALFFNHAVLAQTATVTGARQTWYGNYTVGKTSLVNASTSETGTKRISSGISPPATNSDHMALAADTRFGFGYQLIGAPAKAVVALRYVSKIPPPGIADATTGQLSLVRQNTYNLGIGRQKSAGWDVDASGLVWRSAADREELRRCAMSAARC